MELETPIQVETIQEDSAPGSQPAFQPEPQLNEADVRAAVMAAEAKGNNPLDLLVGDAVQGAPKSQEAPKEVARTATLDVPEKFKTQTGEVDVEKLKASTKAIDEAIQRKEEGNQKSVDDYVREYREKERKLSGLPNPERLQAPAPPVIPDNPSRLTDEQLEAMINQDIQRNPGRAVVQLIEQALKQRLEPFEQDKRLGGVRDNIRQLAEKDSRVLSPQVFAAINAKLDSDPDFWKLKNPHKAAWLEVKEEMRLGEPVPQGQASAQPSRTASPILGGGTPPPAPSTSSGQVTYQSLNEAIATVLKDPNLRRDQKVMDKLDQAAKQYFDRAYR